MKKYIVAATIVSGIFLAGCSTFSGMGYTQGEYGSIWSDYDFHNQEVGQILDPRHRRYGNPRNNPKYRNYRTPRRYHISREDEQKYRNIQDRISKRKMEKQYQSASGMGHQQTRPRGQAQTHSPTTGSSTQLMGHPGE